MPPLRYSLHLLLLSVSISLCGQSTTYFQQKVDYNIQVALLDSIHEIQGQISIDYTHNGFDSLDKMYFHLWPNAYKNNNTAFAKQQVENGDARFFFADPEEKGGIMDLNFEIDGQKVNWQLDEKHIDIAIIILNKKILPGQTVNISTPFTVKIPKSFSRLGRVGTSYQMTQWYPKPAVYDKDGWHPMPYLDQGEFYSEFGNYTVEISLPENYIVAATGLLQTESEQQFLRQKAQEDQDFLDNVENLKSYSEDVDTFPASSPILKTLTYNAENVHDFAWFADKRFRLIRGTSILPNGEEIQTNAFFTGFEAELWVKSLEYLEDALQHYSKRVGNYPYPQVTAVQSALSAGAGMEYPMITVIGKSNTPELLDEVITHEVGHNWFYGILAFNERKYPWMDEGINSFYDHDYFMKKYPGKDLINLPKFISSDSATTLEELGYLYQALQHRDQAPNLPSDEYSNINYGMIIYGKVARSFRLLEQYIGPDRFDEVMQSFYKKWAFRHPDPKDIKAHFNSNIEENLDWFWEGLLASSNYTDYAIKEVSFTTDSIEISLKNVGKVACPVEIEIFKESRSSHSFWLAGFNGDTTVTIPFISFDQITIDPNHFTLDVQRNNNTFRKKAVFKKTSALGLRFLVGLDRSDEKTIYYLPAISGNAHDGLLAGLAFHNGLIPPKNLSWAAAVQYGMHSKKWGGIGTLSRHIYLKGFIDRLELGLDVKRYSLDFNTRFDTPLTYERYAPRITFHLRQAPRSRTFQQIEFSPILVREQALAFDNDGFFDGKETNSDWLYQLTYSLRNQQVINPWSLEMQLEQQSYRAINEDQDYLKLNTTFKSSFTYDRDKSFDLRLFAGFFLRNTRRNSTSFNRVFSRGAIAITHEGYNDYQYEEVLLGRNLDDGFGARQVTIKDGGFKNAFGLPFANNFRTNDFLISANLKGDLPKALPFNLPLKPYLDLAYYSRPNFTPIEGQTSFSEQFVWSGGVMLEFWDDVLAVYFPIVNDDQFQNLYDQLKNNSYWSRITFTFRLSTNNPWKWSRQVTL